MIKLDADVTNYIREKYRIKNPEKWNNFKRIMKKISLKRKIQHSKDMDLLRGWSNNAKKRHI